MSVFFHTVCLSTVSTPEETTPPQTVGTTSLPQTVGTTSLPQTLVTTSLPQTVGPSTTTGTALPVSHLPQPTRSEGAIIPTGTVSISSIQPTNNPSSDGATTTSVIIVVAVVIILVIPVGVVILVVLFSAKKRKQQLEINKLQTITIQSAGIEVKLKQNETAKNEASLSADQSTYEVSNILYQSMDQQVNLKQDGITKKKAILSADQSPYEVSNSLYQSMDQHCDHPSTTKVPQRNDIYTVPNTTSSHAVEADSGTYETVYSDPIQPSLFTDVAGNPSDCEYVQPYGPLY